MTEWTKADCDLVIWTRDGMPMDGGREGVRRDETSRHLECSCARLDPADTGVSYDDRAGRGGGVSLSRRRRRCKAWLRSARSRRRGLEWKHLGRVCHCTDLVEAGRVSVSSVQWRDVERRCRAALSSTHHTAHTAHTGCYVLRHHISWEYRSTLDTRAPRKEMPRKYKKTGKIQVASWSCTHSMLRFSHRLGRTHHRF